MRPSSTRNRFSMLRSTSRLFVMTLARPGLQMRVAAQEKSLSLLVRLLTEHMPHGGRQRVRRGTAPARTCRESDVQKDPKMVGKVLHGGIGSWRLGLGRTWNCSEPSLAGGIAAWSSLYIVVWTVMVSRCCHFRGLGASSVSASAAFGWIPCVNPFGGTFAHRKFIPC